jgi:DNA polymerase III epsilon subunit-like protein
MNKEIVIDLETTGTVPVVHEVLSIGGLVKIDGEIKEKFYIETKPEDLNVKPEILDICGFTIEQIMNFRPSVFGYGELIRILDKYSDKYSQEDKFAFVGYNIDKFDSKFLEAFFIKHKDEFLYSYVGYYVDIYHLARCLMHLGKIKPKSCKLEDVAEYFGIKFSAHNSLEDAIATDKIFDKLNKLILKDNE